MGRVLPRGQYQYKRVGRSLDWCLTRASFAGLPRPVRGERLGANSFVGTGFATKFRQVVAATAAACCYAAPAAADTVSFEDNVFRYRAETRFSFYFNLDLQLAPQGAGFPTHVEALAEPAAVKNWTRLQRGSGGASARRSNVRAYRALASGLPSFSTSR